MNPTQSETTLRTLTGSMSLAKGDAVQNDGQGKLYKKQLFTYGTWANPMWWWDGEPTMELTRELASTMKVNFDSNSLGSPVPVPRNHTDDVNANTGRVTELEVGDDGMYGYLLVVDQKTIDDIDNGLIFDISIGFDWDYVSQKDSVHYGATLFHVALVNTPYINNMSGFVEAELAKRNHDFSTALSIGGRQSVIMMSIDKVEELKRMRFSKIKNDKAFDVDIKYTDDEGAEQTATIKAGEELDVPTTAEKIVKDQVDAAVEPVAEETDEERTAREASEKEAADKAAADALEAEKNKADDDPTKTAPTDGEALAKANARIAELEADKTYDKLLSTGHIVPAQKALFHNLAKAGSINLSTDIKGADGKVMFSKGKETSVITMLSAILNAGPSLVKFGEKGTTAVGDEIKVELTADQEARIVRSGFNLETFKKHLEKGTFSLNDLEEGDK